MTTADVVDMTWPEIMADAVEAGSAVEVWEAQQTALLPIPSDDDPVDLAAANIQAWVDSGLGFVTVLDDEYPQRLLGIHEAPPILFAVGDLRSYDPAVSVIGSRKASSHGLSMAGSIAR